MGTATFEHIIGHDPRFRAALSTAAKAARSNCNILLVGETGTGKELVAEAIHNGSLRAQGPLVAINCGAMAKELIAAELFGHERGAFTGAITERDGVFVQAHGGTLFLDEIGELSLELQTNLLRALESRRIRRLGSRHEVLVDVRIIAATNQMEGLSTGHAALRLDIYHRLATVVVHLPPLRERPSDIPLLVEAFLTKYGSRKTASMAAITGLCDYHWPGNVRELAHAVERAVALGGTVLQLDDFLAADTPLPGAGYQGHVDIYGVPLTPHEEILRAAMQRALLRHGSIRKAAAELGIPKSTYADRAKLWGLITTRSKRRQKTAR